MVVNVNEIISNEERETIIAGMVNLFDEYGYEHRRSALNEIIDVWARNKADLIQHFKAHPNYIEGKFMIAFNKDYKRATNPKAITHFFTWLRLWCIEEMVNTLPKEIDEQRAKEGCSYLPNELYKSLNHDYEYDYYICRITERVITAEQADHINKLMPDKIHAHAGQKTSRVVNKICKYLGYDKHPDYNKEFAKYADALSPMIIRRHTVLSINPLDYLTMSFGNSWASCHTIDKSNKRGMPNSYEGQYSSGTISYMLDKVSMVFYTVDSDYEGDEYYFEPKINRNMFHWTKPNLVQGRLYPQDNDGCSELYTEYRTVVQEIISGLYDFPNLWTNKKGTSAASSHINTEGTHYHDYEHYSNCNLSIIKGEEDNEIMMTVGHEPICIECGDEHHESECINCCRKPNALYCKECGCLLDEDEAIWINGDAYCRSCVEYCERCDEYHRGESYHIRDYGDVCEGCYNEFYTCCDECNDDVDREDTHWIDDEEIRVCDYCYERHFTECPTCGINTRINDSNFVNRSWYCDDCVDDAREENESEEAV